MAANKRSGQEKVAEFMNALEHPMKDVIEEVRALILGVDDQITEQIKWNAPSFCFNNDDRITFNLQGKGFIRLVLHTRAKVQQRIDIKSQLEDTSRLLEWATADRAIIKLTSMNDVESQRAELVETVAKWLEATATK
ncbi:DUF1801 domain-containing protein [Paenibacillus sp. YIM B09110]|uniref:DUF1801 domain-containing protein n=1 Tax=Paenibacillus sp. YIM B09110 TaxID=3126102 RepID=UPI00301DC00E